MDDVNQILELPETQDAQLKLPTWSADSQLSVKMQYNYAEKLGAEVDFKVRGYQKNRNYRHERLWKINIDQLAERLFYVLMLVRFVLMIKR